MSFTKFVFFEPIGKTRWPPWPLIGLNIFDFSSETTERPATKLDRKKDLNVLYQVCVFWADRKNKTPPWPIRQKGSTLYSGARYVALWASCFGIFLPSTETLLLGFKMSRRGPVHRLALFPTGLVHDIDVLCCRLIPACSSMHPTRISFVIVGKFSTKQCMQQSSCICDALFQGV